MDKFLKYQEARFAKHGDERWEKEQEMEEREYDMRMVANMFRPPPPPSPPAKAGLLMTIILISCIDISCGIYLLCYCVIMYLRPPPS